MNSTVTTMVGYDSRKQILASQRGAALFTALMILIILSILGVAAARVTALQERMVGVYLADIEAFQNAEDLARDNERTILASDPDTICYPPLSETGALPSTWVNQTATVEAARFLNIGRIPGMALQDSAVAGGNALEPGGIGCTFFRVSTLDFDDAGQTSRAVVETIYVP